MSTKLVARGILVIALIALASLVVWHDGWIGIVYFVLTLLAVFAGIGLLVLLVWAVVNAFP